MRKGPSRTLPKPFRRKSFSTPFYRGGKMILCKEVLRGIQGEAFPQKVPPEKSQDYGFVFSRR